MQGRSSAAASSVALVHGDRDGFVDRLVEIGTVTWPLLVTVASPKSCSTCLTLIAPSRRSLL